MIVRELIAKFGVDFDKSGANKAEQSVNTLKQSLSSLGVAFSAGAMVAGLTKLVSAASDVDEEMNVVSQTFGASTQTVLDWAKQSGDVMGRSQFSMRKYAGALGAVLAPTLGNKAAAAELSTTIAGLAVDLGSFFNKGDEETLERLRSGLLGSSEAVDQLGINLRVESLQAFAASRGITKSYKSMTEAEKVQLRFNKIMADTIDKQGDAARTGAGFANSSKRLKENLYDVAVTIGQKLLGPATSLIRLFSNTATGLGALVSESYGAETALGMLGYAALVFAGRWAIMNLPLLLAVGALVLVGLAIEDLITGLEGGQSVIKDWFESLAGADSWAAVVRAWKSGKEALTKLLSGDVAGAESALIDIAEPNKVLQDSRAMQGANAELEREDMRQGRGSMSGHAGLNRNPWAPWMPTDWQDSIDKMLVRPAWKENLNTTLKQPDAPTYFGPNGPVSRGGDINITVGAGASPDAVREAERAARRLQAEQSRTLMGTTNTAPVE
jgi:hypothetical protein